MDAQCYSLFQRTIATTMALLRSRAALPLHVCGTGERRTSNSELHDRFMRISMFSLVRCGGRRAGDGAMELDSGVAR